MTEPARERLLRTIEGLRVWRRGDERAPHKPLLVLTMLGRLRGTDRLVAFTDVEGDLRALLRDFGPPRRQHHPEHPFWHLRSDEIWELEGVEPDRPAQATASLGEARQLRGGLPHWAWACLRDDPALVRDVAERLLTAHFPPSLHEDILDRVGLDLAVGPARRAQRRDPAFRVTVLRAYEYRCAVCDYDGKLDATPVALDAAHVRWWAAGGPDVLENALALCSLHHKAFDLGVLGVARDRRVQVSGAFHGGDRSTEFVTRFAGTPLRSPQPGVPALAEPHRAWHEREVFRDPPRTAGLAAESGSPPYGGR